MRFSVELELHDAIGRPDSVGNFLQFRQILPLECASRDGSCQGRAGCKALIDAPKASFCLVGKDLDASWLIGPVEWYLPIKSRPDANNGTVIYCIRRNFVDGRIIMLDGMSVAALFSQARESDAPFIEQ